MKKILIVKKNDMGWLTKKISENKC